MKKFFIMAIAILILALAFTFISGSWAQDRIQVTVDGDPLVFDQPPVMIGNSVMVPMPGVFERLGATVNWNGSSRTITATRAGTEIILPLGSTRASINGEGRTLSVPASSIGGRTMVPLRFVSEALNSNVQWYGNSRTVAITSGQQGQQASAHYDSRTLSSGRGATLELNDIVIRKMNDEINFRVRVKNTGTMAATNLDNNMVVYLRVRDTTTGYWRELQRWSNIDVIKPGETVSRDRTPVKATDPAVLSDRFTLQAEIVLQNRGNITISRAILEKSYPEDAIQQP